MRKKILKPERELRSGLGLRVVLFVLHWSLKVYVLHRAWKCLCCRWAWKCCIRPWKCMSCTWSPQINQNISFVIFLFFSLIFLEESWLSIYFALPSGTPTLSFRDPYPYPFLPGPFPFLNQNTYKKTRR